MKYKDENVRLINLQVMMSPNLETEKAPVDDAPDRRYFCMVASFLKEGEEEPINVDIDFNKFEEERKPEVMDKAIELVGLLEEQIIEFLGEDFNE